jgi:uncharacterized protein (TIGR02452 family)
MYAAHAKRSQPDSSDWAILSPDIPVFRSDDGTPLYLPWTVDFLTCAAPYASAIGQSTAGELLQTKCSDGANGLNESASLHRQVPLYCIACQMSRPRPSMP